ncbi:MFS transporter [Georgenia sp. Z1491]|uniref:MFS transporter n=1 Tax=Georgenia sp. Z1491 TaxID=3416707 RepID=UPI003CE889C6
MTGSGTRAGASDRPHPLLLIPAGLLASAAGWGLTAAGAAAGTLARSHGTTLVTIGLLTTVFAVAYAALQIPTGVLVDRWGVRRTAFAGLGLTVLAYAAAVVTPSLLIAFPARLLAGAGCAVGFVAGAELARRSRTGPTGLGVFGGMAIGTGGIAVAVIPALEDLLGWRSAWITCIAVAVLAGLLVLLLVDDAPQEGPPAATASGARPHLLRDPELLRLAAVHASTFGIGVVLGNWTGTILTERWGMEPRTASTVASLVLATTLVSRPLGGYLTSLIGHRSRSLVAVSLVACAVGTLLLAVPSTPAVAVVATLTIGVASGLPFASALAGAQRLRDDRPGAAVGVLNAAANFLVVIGTPLLAWAIERGATAGALVVVAVAWAVPLLALPRTLNDGPTRPGSARPGRP